MEEDDGEEMFGGLLLVSARTALWGRFPLNGTYFQASRCHCCCNCCSGGAAVAASSICNVHDSHAALCNASARLASCRSGCWLECLWVWEP